jgi:hypothetical protein
MRFSTVLCTVGAFAAAVLAGENPIYHPDGTDMITAGSPYNITWNPTTSGKITLTLRQGESTNLDTIGVIATVENSGWYLWTPDKDLPSGEDYAIMITSESGDVNYTPLIPITGSTSSSAKASTASKTASKTATKSGDIKVESATKSATLSSTTAIITPYPLSNSTSGHNSTMTTSTRASNSSKTSAVPSSSSEPSSSSTPASGAIAIARSPLALVACLVGAIVYLN